MGMIPYNPTQVKRKVIKQVIYFMVLLHMTLKTLIRPTDMGKVKLKHLDSK